MDSNEKKEILETVVTYLTGALDEAKDELAVLEKAEAPEPEPPTLHHLDWGIDNKGDFLFFILNDGRFKAWTLYGGYCKDFTVEVTEDYIKDVSIKGNLQSIFEQLAIDDMVSNVAGAIKEMALKSGYVEPDRKFPRQQENPISYFHRAVSFLDDYEKTGDKGILADWINMCGGFGLKKEQLEAEILGLKAALLWSKKFDSVTGKELREFFEARKSGHVEPDRKFPQKQEDSQGYCPECQAKIIAAKDGEFVPICAKCLIGASREFYLKKVV